MSPSISARGTSAATSLQQSGPRRWSAPTFLQFLKPAPIIWLAEQQVLYVYPNYAWRRLGLGVFCVNKGSGAALFLDPAMA